MAAVDICNSALIKIGVEKISALSDNSRQAILCNEQYDKLRKALLREHPWNFAVKRAALTDNGNTPAWDYEYEFDLPADCLRILNTQYADTDFQVEGGKILARADELNIRYISDEDDTTKFPPDFQELLALKIAIDLSYTLIQSNSTTGSLLAQYDRMLRDVRSFDGQENPSQEVTNDLFIVSRY
jgi:hypothetical protein